MLAESVRNMTSLSMPMPHPAVGGSPYSSAWQNDSSSIYKTKVHNFNPTGHHPISSVYLCFVVACVAVLDLPAEQLPLHHRIIQLGIRIGNFL